MARMGAKVLTSLTLLVAVLSSTDAVSNVQARELDTQNPCNYPAVEMFLSFDGDCSTYYYDKYGKKVSKYLEGYLYMNNFDTKSWDYFVNYQASSKINLKSKGQHSITVCFKSFGWADLGGIAIGQTAASVAYPYKVTKLQVPGVIPSISYTSYKDVDTSNGGKPGVSKNQNGIAYIKTGEWLKYSPVTVNGTGSYTVNYRLARHCAAVTAGADDAKTCPAGQTPCGATSSSGYSSPNNICCTSTEDCILGSSPGGSWHQCSPKDRPKTCSPNPCVHGECFNFSTGPGCQCDDGWEGLFCDKVFGCDASKGESPCGHWKAFPEYGGLGHSDNYCCTAGKTCAEMTDYSGVMSRCQ